MTCKDCFHWVVCQGDAPYYSAGAEHCTSWASAEDINAPTKWIPVTERLPKYGEVVLIAFRWDAVDTGWCCEYGWRGEYAPYEDGEVTHWMPLPEPPKEDAE